MIQEKIYLRLLVITTLLVLVGCGGGNSTDVINPSNSLNPGLSGKLLFKDSDKAWLMDVATGSYSQIPNTEWFSNDTVFGIADSFWLHPAPNDSTEFMVESQDDCFIDNFPNTGVICVAIQDYSGNYLATYQYLGKSASAAKMSWDRQHFALFNADVIAHLEELEIYDRGGNLVSTNVVTEDGFAWLQDDRIIYAADRKFFITRPVSTEAEFQITLPDQILGSIGSVTVSPDGNQLAFSLIQSGTLVSNHATPWVMNIDGTDLRQLASSPDPEPTITSPQWSPDGKWILLREGGFTGSNPLNPGSSDYAYIVPAKYMGKIFILSLIDSENLLK